MRSDFSLNNLQYIGSTRTVIVHAVVVVAVIPFVLDVWLVDVRAGVTQEESHTGFRHLPFAVVCRIDEIGLLVYY